MAAQRPPLPRVIRATGQPLAELERATSSLSNDVRNFVKELAEQEYDVTKVQARILWRSSIGG